MYPLTKRGILNLEPNLFMVLLPYYLVSNLQLTAQICASVDPAECRIWESSVLKLLFELLLLLMFGAGKTLTH